MADIKTVRDLETDPRFKEHNPFYFSPSTLRFFGERKSEMKVLEKHEVVDGHECIVLRHVQHNAPDGMEVRYTYFDVDTLKWIGSKAVGE